MVWKAAWSLHAFEGDRRPCPRPPCLSYLSWMNHFPPWDLPLSKRTFPLAESTAAATREKLQYFQVKSLKVYEDIKEHAPPAWRRSDSETASATGEPLSEGERRLTPNLSLLMPLQSELTSTY